MSVTAQHIGKRATYPAYKPSGMDWVGDVPEHWEVRRLKHIATINDEALPETTEPDYGFTYVDIGSVDASKGIVATETYRFEDAPSRARRIVREGDTIVSTVRTYLRAIAAMREPAENLIVSTGFAVVRPRSLDSGFLSYALRSPFFVETVVSRSTGVSYPAINAPEVGNIGVTLPPLDEQKAIAAFLDRETARIDALIEKKRRQIELLQEKRSALISHAVTKGLNPNAPTKDSGIEWLGRIPRDWRVLQFRRVIRALEQGWSPVAEGREAEKDEWAVLKISSVAQGRFRPNEHKALPPALEPETRYEVRPGDLLLTRSNTLERVGDACFIRHTRDRLIMSDLIYRLHLDQRLCLHAFACYWLISRPGRAAIEADARGTSGSMVKIAQSHIRTWPIMVPPLEEQKAIVRQLDRELTRLEGIVGHIEESIDCLREHRTALISAAVTGKIDVRGEVA